MPNIINFPTVTIVKNGQSVTGSFYKIQVMASGSVVGAAPYSAGAPGHIRALKDSNGVDIVSASLTGGLFVPPGTVIEMMITSASLDATSAPVLFYS
jgi:hypothetical protein